MHTRWKLGLFALASLGFEFSSASVCRPRPPILSKQPTPTDGSLPVGDATSISTWNHYTSIASPETSALGSQESSAWGVIPGSRDQESLPPGETTVLMSHGTASSHATHETGSVSTDRSSRPIATSFDGDTTTKQLGSLPFPDTTMGVSVPAIPSDGGTDVDTASLTGEANTSDTATVDHSSAVWHDSDTTPSLMPSESVTSLPNTSALTIPTLTHHSPSHGNASEVPSSPVESATRSVFETVSTTSYQSQDTDGSSTTPADIQRTSFPTGSLIETDTSVLTGSSLPHTFPPSFTHSFTTDAATFTGPVESQDETSVSSEGEIVITTSSGPATLTPEDASLPHVVTATSLSRDDYQQSSDVPTSPDDSRLTLEIPTSNADDPASLVTATSEEHITARVSDEQTHSDVLETQAPVKTLPDEHTTTSAGLLTGPIEATTLPADSKSTASNDESPSTSTGLSKTQGQQTTVTGTHGEIATWSAVRDPDLSDVSQTQTQTDDDGAIIVIFPGGWKWSPVGGGRKGGPTPTAVPTVEGDDQDEPDDGDDEEDRCTSTRPPTCTMTMSYYTNDQGEGTSTRIGTCSPVTGCVLGDQSTTTTTIASEIPRITGFEPEEEEIMSLEYLPVDEKVVEYYLDAFKRWGVANVDEGPEAECESGILVNTSVECLELFSGPFCAVVNKDETQQATRNFTYEEVKAKDERSLHARQSLCASYVFNFDWTGADGDCKLSCTEAFSTLKSQCAVPVLGRLAPEGTLDVGCGNYTYQANREALFDPSSSVVLPSTTSTVTAVISPTEQFSTMASSSSTTAMSTKSATSTKEPEPAETNAYFGVHNLQCNKEDDYPGHASVQEEALTFEINNACRDVSKKGWHMTPKDDLIEWEYKDYVGVKHRFTWSWKKDCTAENGDVDLGNPLNEDDGVERCVFIFGEAWTRCNNGGVGGSQDVGCVQYLLEAGI